MGKRIAVGIATASLAVAGAFGMSACSSPASATTLSPEQSALTSLGFTTADVSGDATTGNGTVTPVADPSASAGTAPKGKGKHPRLRKLAIRRLALAKRTEHGSVTVETKKGDQTIDVQRGTVTALTSTTMTVKSSDGYSQTWTISGPLTVIAHRTKVQPDALASGDTVGVAGIQTGSTVTAKLVVEPNKAPAKTGS